MSYHSGLSKISNMIGNCRSMLLGRPVVLAYQQTAGLKQSLEEKVGLPKKPSRPLTPYFRFMQENRPTIKKNNPNFSVLEIAKLVGVYWEKANPSIKEQLTAAYKKDMEVYAQAMTRYNSNLSAADREKLDFAKKAIALKKEKIELRTKAKEQGKPKKPATPFILFTNDRLSLKGNKSMEEFRSESANLWNSMSEKEKEPYAKRYLIAAQEYKRNINSWEEKMIRKGHVDLIRNDALIDRRPSPKKSGRKA